MPPQHPPVTVIELDARGLLCPLPVLRAQRLLRDLSPGARLRLCATDPASWIDVPHFCATAGHRLLSAEDRDGVKTYLIERGPDRPSTMA